MVLNPDPSQLSFINKNITEKNQNNGKHSLSYADNPLPVEPNAGSRSNPIAQPLWVVPLRALTPTRSGTQVLMQFLH